MRILALGVSVIAIGLAAASALAQSRVPAADEPFWAWGWLSATDTRPTGGPPADPMEKHTVPGSTLVVARGEIGAYSPPDWFPSEHPVMPPIVAKGDQARTINACSFCHLPNGLGRPENGNISGLPVEYFRQQILDFKNGKRVTSDPRKTNTATMTNFAKNLTDEEINQAAQYFVQIKQPEWIKVVEAATVPKTVGTGNWLTVVEGAAAGTEPIGNRIIETPVSPEDQEKWRNPHSGFIAYVPPGSIAKGKQLVETGGGGRFAACTVCHGQDLRGLGPIPPLAGRSPSYIARQLYDMQNGNRSGAWTPLMAAVVAALEPGDLVNIAAYAASLKP